MGAATNKTIFFKVEYESAIMANTLPCNNKIEKLKVMSFSKFS